MRHTRAHTGNRRSHHALTPKNFSKCSSCSALKLGHTACMNCGKYKGREVVNKLAKTAKRTKKNKAAAK